VHDLQIHVRPVYSRKGMFIWTATVDGIEVDSGRAISSEEAVDQAIYCLEDWKAARDFPLFAPPYPVVTITPEA